MTTPKHKQLGITLLEVMISITIISLVMLGINSLVKRFALDTQNTITASHMRIFGDAAKAYIKAHSDLIKDQITGNVAAVLLDYTTLNNDHRLPPGYSPTNAYGQSVCAVVTQANNQLQGMVVAEGGTDIDDYSLGNVASLIGGGGGGIYRQDTANVYGAFNGWKFSTGTFGNKTNNQSDKNCMGTAGVKVQMPLGHPAMALWFDTTGGLPLVRNDVSVPSLNTMTTPLIMDGIAGAGGLNCTTGAIARATAPNGVLPGGALLYCDGTRIWKQMGPTQWKDPVGTRESLPAACVDGDVRATTIGTYLGTYLCISNTWRPLGVDDQGDLAVGRDITANNNITATSLHSTSVNTTRVDSIDVTATTVNSTNVIASGTLQGQRLILMNATPSDNCDTVGEIALSNDYSQLAVCKVQNTYTVDQNGNYIINQPGAGKKWHTLGAPQGTLCGITHNGGVSTDMKCMGYTVLNENSPRVPAGRDYSNCPIGYQWFRIFDVSGHQMFSCVKL